MIDAGSTEFVLAVPALPGQDLRRLSSSLFDSWEGFVDSSVSIPDYSLFLQVEEGSIKGAATIGTFLWAVYMGIGNYGSFVSGLETITKQVSASSDYLTERAHKVFSCPPSRASAKKRGGSLAAIQRLFVRVQRGELTPEEATARAETILGDEARTEPKFMARLAEALQHCPPYHQQQPLPFVEQTEELDFLAPPRSTNPPRPAKPPSTLGPPLHLRVEVWRESKNKRKHTRIIKL